MTDAVLMALVGADRDRMLATLMEEWSPLQHDLMDQLHVEEEDLRRRRSLARARLLEAVRARASEDYLGDR